MKQKSQRNSFPFLEHWVGVRVHPANLLNLSTSLYCAMALGLVGENHFCGMARKAAAFCSFRAWFSVYELGFNKSQG